MKNEVKRDLSAIKNVFIERIHDLMLEKNNMSISKLARETGLPNGSLSNWLLGYRTIQIDSLCVLANYFGVTTDYLLGREN